jgi:hypothetical protein
MRYFFDVEDGAVVRDEHGAEVQGAQALSLMAVETIADAMKKRGSAFWNSPSLTLTVRDGDGLTLLAIQVVGTLAAAFPASTAEARLEIHRPRISGLLPPE